MDTQGAIIEIASVRYQACSMFRPVEDHPVCECGWFEEEHTVLPELSVTRVRALRRQRTVQLPERRAS
jgi:hypothetical protein